MKRSRSRARSLVLALASLLAASVASAGLAAFSSACSSDSPGASPGSADASTPSAEVGPHDDAGQPEAASDAGTGGGAEDASTCDLTRAFTIDCSARSDAGESLTCGAAKFDAWCALNDQAINSEAYRQAEARCLTHQNCAPGARADCELRSLAMATPTAAQTQLVAAYCQTCEPGDPTSCAMRKTSYDPAKGPSSTDDVFIAAWELTDTLTTQIRTQCTGTGLDGGIVMQTDAGAADPCLKAFASCAGDLYVNALPDCPK